VDKARWFKVTQGCKVVYIECWSLTDMTDNDVMVPPQSCDTRGQQRPIDDIATRHVTLVPTDHVAIVTTSAGLE